MRRLYPACLILALSISPSLAAPAFVLCSAADKDDIVLELESETFEGKLLSCLTGGDFIVDMTPCAPDGGYGLSAPTGSAALVDVVERWQDYGNHMGGVVSFAASPTSYRFQGGFMFPDSGYQESWTFDVSRLSGKGELSIVQEVEEGGEVGRSLDIYDCRQVERKF